MPEILDDHLMEPSPGPAGGFEFYRDFFMESQVVEFENLLNAHQIPYSVEKSRLLIDKSIAGQGLTPFAVVKLRPVDFGRVGQLLAKSVEDNPQLLDSHYFQGFTATELLEVLRKPDEWTPEDIAAAQILLKRQGVVVPTSQVAAYQQERTEALRSGKPVGIGLLLLHAVFAVLGGLFISLLFFLWGMGMAWYYWKDRTTDMEGQQFFTFATEARQWGKAIFLLGWGSLALGLVLRFAIGLQAPQLFNFHF
ncbi:MAG: hypothetical protein MUC59_03150 [Saprospiraceae bacterium]|nr:hypothetical protein [Saprospiraceae bacterium]